MLSVEAPPAEADFLIGGVNPSRVGEGLRVVRRCLSPVVGGAWRVPGGGNAPIFANLQEHPVEFSAPLDGTRLVLSLPLHAAGRTFSEDGDAPSATVRGVGTRVEGKLAARSVVLVTLYQ